MLDGADIAPLSQIGAIAAEAREDGAYGSIREGR